MTGVVDEKIVLNFNAGDSRMQNETHCLTTRERN